MLRLYAHNRLSDEFVAYVGIERLVMTRANEWPLSAMRKTTLFLIYSLNTPWWVEIYEDWYVNMGTGRYNVWAVVVESYAFASGECISVASFLNAPGSGWPSVTVSILVELMWTWVIARRSQIFAGIWKMLQKITAWEILKNFLIVLKFAEIIYTTCNLCISTIRQLYCVCQ